MVLILVDLLEQLRVEHLENVSEQNLKQSLC